MKCKYIPVYFLLVIVAACSTKKENKYFSGTIEYAYSYNSDSLNTDSLIKARPSKGFFRYDENDYQSRFTGADTNTYYYSGKLNKAVAEYSLQKELVCEDYGTATDSIISYKLYDTDEKILGYSCRVIELQKSRSWVKYYFSGEHTMSSVTYQNHKAYNWDFYGEKAEGGLVLKVEHRFKLFTMSGIATNLKEYNKGFKALEIDKILMDSLCTVNN
ncbi:MAG: hypothetical protein HOP10_03540 [Chitinophagaceae bacterium]|nr:hypothetical protein [Chitinophagaceae bacterium]